MTRLLLSLGVISTLTVGAAACECNGQVQTVKLLNCGYTGSLQASSPTLSLPTTIPVNIGGTCLRVDGLCDGTASVLFVPPTTNQLPRDDLSLGFVAALTAGPGSYALVGQGADVGVIATVYRADANYVVTDLHTVVQSGELVISRNDAEQFAGTFAVELDTEDGLHHVSVTRGTFDVGPCRIHSEEACIGPNAD